MNIRQAKEQILSAVTAYRTRDAYGRPMIPLERQRPLFLLGAPGIGKTAVVEQAARESGIALVSYAMTHHTRQSALGLPFIAERDFGGVTSRVSEYTMSEIIASVYEKMEETGLKEGILFLDEINCVSETLSPAMLQFLQYKVFGRHRLPAGWIVVTAGNPPEYNRSVRDFDMATWDRLKRIEIEPDFDVWREWAVNNGVHPAVTAYLETHRDDFCRIEATAEGREFVTPRGWVDLSDMLRLCELNALPIDGLLIAQYLQCRETAARFAEFFELWRKYRGEYRIEDILSGQPSDALVARAKAAAFDERISLIGLVLDGVRTAIRPVMRKRAALEALLEDVRPLRQETDEAACGALMRIIEARKAALESRLRAGTLSPDAEDVERLALEILEELRRGCAGAQAQGTQAGPLPQAAQGDMQPQATQRSAASQAATPLNQSAALFQSRVEALKKAASEAGARLENGFAFLEAAFGEGQELLVFVTGLTAAKETARFIAISGSEGYARHNRSLLFYEREMSVLREIDRLDGASDDDQAP